jgi:hypothetical protein
VYAVASYTDSVRLVHIDIAIAGTRPMMACPVVKIQRVRKKFDKRAQTQTKITLMGPLPI